MDPSKLLDEIRDAIEVWNEGMEDVDTVAIVMQGVEWLDEWLSKDGFLPRQWDSNA
jgi:hypothetical protein